MCLAQSGGSCLLCSWLGLTVLLSCLVSRMEAELQHGTMDPSLLFHYLLGFTEESKTSMGTFDM